MLVVGLVGPTGAGKSAVLDMLRELGAAVLRADDASRELLAPGSRLLSEVRAHLGDAVFRADGSLDRSRTAALIFSDEQARRKLEALVHPPMVQWLRQRLEELRQRPDPPPVAVVEAAVLTHMGARHLVDRVIRVAAPPEVCLARVQERDHVSADVVAQRLAVQQQLGLFDEPADFVLDTTGTLAQTRERVRALWGKLQAEAAGAPSP